MLPISSWLCSTMAHGSGVVFFERLLFQGRYNMFSQSTNTLRNFRRSARFLVCRQQADPHVDDPLGGWLTTAELRDRDRLVFETAQRGGIPIAWNLAGGYQEPLRKVLDIHDNTMLACASVFA